MKIEPKNGPTIIKPATATTASSSDAYSRAIAKFNEGLAKPEAAPVAEPRKEEIPVETKTSVESTPNDSSAESRLTTNSEAVSPQASESEVTDKPASKDPLSSQYAILARKEKAYRASIQKLNAEREAFKAERESFTKSQNEDLSSKYISKDKLLNDTWGTLSELGISYETIANAALNGPSAEQLAIKKLEAQVKADVERLANEMKSREEETAKNSYNQALNQIRSEVTSLVSSDESFETIKETDSVSDVVELIEKTFKETGELLSVEAAAREVEEYLVEEAMKIAKLKKIQQRLNPVTKAPAAPAQAPLASAVEKQSQLKTLTNAVSSSAPISARERAIAAFKGQLKS